MPLLADELATLLTILFYTSVIGAAVVVAGSLLVVGSTDGHDGRQFGALAAGYVAFFASDSLLLLTRFGLLPPADATILFSYYAVSRDDVAASPLAFTPSGSILDFPQRRSAACRRASTISSGRRMKKLKQINFVCFGPIRAKQKRPDFVCFRTRKTKKC